MLEIKKKIGQMFMVTVEPDHVTPDLENFLVDYHIGGVILFQKNLTDRQQTMDFIREIQIIARKNDLPPLWISIDQEGGGIAYLSDEMTVSPGNMLIGATSNEKNAYRAGYLMAKQLKAIGFNMNYAPVLDINNNPLNPVIGTRSFGADPQLVSRMGIEMIKGHYDAGLLAVGKHFPGHGDTHLDSHLSLPIVSKSKEMIQSFEFKPFKDAIEAGLEALMTAHIVFPSFDSAYPASLSPNILHHILRNQLKFNGLIITDSLEMKAVADHFGRGQGAVLAIQAGADIVLACGRNDASQINMIEQVFRAIEKGSIPHSLIDRAHKRILQTKAKWIKPNELMNNRKTTKEALTKPSLQERMIQIALEGITKVKDDMKLLPVDPDQDRIWLIGTKTFNDEIYSGCRINPAFEIFPSGNYNHLTLNGPLPTEKEGAYLQTFINPDDIVILLINERRQLDYSWNRYIDNILAITSRVILVSLWNPQIINNLTSNISTYIVTYSNTRETIQALRKLLEGECPFRGTLPVKLGEAR